MKKILVILLLCFTSLFAVEESGNALEELIQRHKDANEIHADQLRVLNNLLILLKSTLLTKQNLIFELKKEAELLYIVIVTEGERFDMINTRSRKIFEK